MRERKGRMANNDPGTARWSLLTNDDWGSKSEWDSMLMTLSFNMQICHRRRRIKDGVEHISTSRIRWQHGPCMANFPDDDSEFPLLHNTIPWLHYCTSSHDARKLPKSITAQTKCFLLAVYGIFYGSQTVSQTFPMTQKNMNARPTKLNYKRGERAF